MRPAFNFANVAARPAARPTLASTAPTVAAPAPKASAMPTVAILDDPRVKAAIRTARREAHAEGRRAERRRVESILMATGEHEGRAAQIALGTDLDADAAKARLAERAPRVAKAASGLMAQRMAQLIGRN